MKAYRTDVILFLTLLVLVSIVVLILANDNHGIDIHLTDTYIVLDSLVLWLMLLGPLTFFIFLIRSVFLKFRSVGANIGLIAGIGLLALITYKVIEFQNFYFQELQQQRFSHTDVIIAAVKDSLAWLWTIFSFWMLCVLLLGLKTLRIAGRIR